MKVDDPTRTGEFERRLRGGAVEDVELGLDRMEAALRFEGLDDPSHETILVAGTNGKGETAAHIAGVLQSHGRRVGLFTSPHLLELRERWRLDGRPIDANLVSEVGDPLIARYGREGESELPSLTYFELTALIAAAAFERRKVDVAVLEVGLGGRLDAVNAFPRDAAVITTVGYDHTEWLGDTIEEIATEKCGILRSGVPTVVGHQIHSGAAATIEKHADRGCTRFFGDDYSVRNDEIRLETEAIDADVDVDDGPAGWNRSAAVQTAALVLGDEFDAERASAGVARTTWPGRRERRTLELDGSPSTDALVDTAHNREAVSALASFLEREDASVEAVLFGALADKPLAEIFEVADDGPPVWGARLNSKRSLEASELRELIPETRLESVGSVDEQLPLAARRAAERGGTLLVFGSTYLVGEVFDASGIEADDLVTYRHRGPPGAVVGER